MRPEKGGFAEGAQAARHGTPVPNLTVTVHGAHPGVGGGPLLPLSFRFESLDIKDEPQHASIRGRDQ